MTWEKETAGKTRLRQNRATAGVARGQSRREDNFQSSRVSPSHRVVSDRTTASRNASVFLISPSVVLEWFSYQSPWRINRVSYYTDFHRDRFIPRVIMSGDGIIAGERGLKIYTLSFLENSMYRKNRKFSRKGRLNAKRCPREMPRLISTWNISGGTPRVAPTLFWKIYTISIVRGAFFKVVGRKGTNFQMIGRGDVWTIAL